MCTDDQHKERLAILCLIEAALRPRPPIDFMVQISDLKFWPIDYHERKHIFMWIPNIAGLTLSFEDFGTGPVTGHVWTNLAFPQGTKIATTTSGTVLNTIMFRCTDEVVP